MMLVVIVVGAALLVFDFVGGLLASFTAGGPSNLVTTTSVLSVPGTYDASGIISFTITDRASSDIIGVTFSCPAQFNSATCASPAPASVPLTADFNDAAVGAANPLPVGSTASATGLVESSTSFTAGTPYVIIVQITFKSGSTSAIVANVQSIS